MSGTILLSAFDGWNDACQAATDVVRHLVKTYESKEIRHIGCECFYDYQTNRPMRCHVNGRPRIIWPQTTFYEISVRPQLHIYAELAPEPNYEWADYCRQSLAIASEFEVDHIVTLGSMFADCPHTRTLPLSVCRNCQDCRSEREYDGPIGISSIMEAMAMEEGLDTTSLWVSIPQYLGSDECAQGSLQLLQKISSLINIDLCDGDLPKKAAEWKSQADVLTRCNDSLADYVQRLEHDYDLKQQALKIDQVGTQQAEQLVKEAEEFLSHVDD